MLYEVITDRQQKTAGSVLDTAHELFFQYLGTQRYPSIPVGERSHILEDRMPVFSISRADHQ